ncbi:hypothetical protein HPB47_022015 [Ixodes persulcatus]|uniref:Uncharacterized protein n=1 Tax=Ixodes persulcatus TaxID=34615 RepID=A0AC60QEB0_IXOPE|nr:hypothetical protein HPB47_022015 [Ixodes persulcatus]
MPLPATRQRSCCSNCRSFPTDLNTTGVDNLREIVRTIVREELRKILPAADRPPSLSLAEVVREKFRSKSSSPTCGGTREKPPDTKFLASPAIKRQMEGGRSRCTDDKMDTQSSGIPLLTPGNEVVEVEGEEITPEEFHSAGGSEKKALNLTAGSKPNRTLGRNNGRDGRARIKKAPRPPKLPEDDAKIVFRLRGGLNVRKEDRLSSENAGHDAFHFNEEQNTLIVSTPALENAVKYGGVHSMSLKGQTFEVVAYAIPPYDTIKGVIHGIPDEDSEQAVLNNLVTARNPNVLHARRMGRSKSAVVLFKGQKVPFWIMYGNVEYKCNLYKKRSKYARCKICNALNPTNGHTCSPSCGIYGKAHRTGDTRCKQRFKTPYILQKRQWEKKKKQEESRLKEEDFPPLPKGWSRSRSRASVRSTSRQWFRSRRRSKSRKRSSSRQRVSWAGVTDHKASKKKSKEAKTQNDK